VDTFLAIASKRDERRFADRPVPDDVTERILDAGRVSGNSQNKQAWRFVVVEDLERRERLAGTVYAPDNVRGAALVVAITGRPYDVGRCSQNMMLAAWNEGVASCPAGIRDRDAAAAVLGLEDDEPTMAICFGYPMRPRDPESRTSEEWSARANRKPLGDLVTRL
jgi:nitroreductase